MVSGTATTCLSAFCSMARIQAWPTADPEGTGATIKKYQIRGFPTVFVIDQKGILVATVPGNDHDRLETLVRSLLDKPRIAKLRRTESKYAANGRIASLPLAAAPAPSTAASSFPLAWRGRSHDFETRRRCAAQSVNANGGHFSIAVVDWQLRNQSAKN